MQALESEKVSKFTFMEMNIINGLTIENTDADPVPHSHDSDRIKRLIRYNKDLDEQMSLIHLNESFLESKLEELEGFLSVSDSIARYSLARLTELTLFCVGNYANNNCITEVGDFMINPRLILVHIKGEQIPIKKERHTRFSVQFKSKETEYCSVVEWLELNTMIETVKEPILTYLINLLEKNGCSGEYIASVRKRMNMIVELISYLSMARIPKETNMIDWKSSLEENDRIMIEDLFFRFDTTVFYELGEKIRRNYESSQFAVL